jgi:hypothetical protein
MRSGARPVDEPQPEAYHQRIETPALVRFLSYPHSSKVFAKGGVSMPLFEVETESHIIITWAQDQDAAADVVQDAYPHERVLRLTKRPRDTWVISKSALGIANQKTDPCHTARDCLSKAAGDKVHAIRLYMHETGSDLERARKVIESNMVMGW